MRAAFYRKEVESAAWFFILAALIPRHEKRMPAPHILFHFLHYNLLIFAIFAIVFWLELLVIFVMEI